MTSDMSPTNPSGQTTYDVHKYLLKRVNLKVLLNSKSMYMRIVKNKGHIQLTYVLVVFSFFLGSLKAQTNQYNTNTSGTNVGTNYGSINVNNYPAIESSSSSKCSITVKNDSKQDVYFYYYNSHDMSGQVRQQRIRQNDFKVIDVDRTRYEWKVSNVLVDIPFEQIKAIDNGLVDMNNGGNRLVRID